MIIELIGKRDGSGCYCVHKTNLLRRIFFQFLQGLPFGFFYPEQDEQEAQGAYGGVYIERPVGAQLFGHHGKGKNQDKVGGPQGNHGY